jgi:hypothetical protein
LLINPKINYYYIRNQNEENQGFLLYEQIFLG